MTIAAHGPDGVQLPERRVHVVQGEHYVTNDPSIMLTTILGSCVSACIRDRLAGLGGMNHFLLPGGEGEDVTNDSVRYGAYAMEILVNGLLRQGARRERLEAKLFGGARVITGLTDIGEQNARFAERYLKQEGISLAGGSLGGDRARRIQFWPITGRVRQLALAKEEANVFEAERRVKPSAPVDSGALELF
jgi:chemotaxis protein CheD